MSIGPNIYNVPSSLDQLAAADPTIKVSYRRVIPRANATGEAFPNSSINFNWVCGGNEKWIPARSFVCIHNRMFENANTFAVQPYQNNRMGPGEDRGQKAAPSWLQPYCLFDSASIKVGSYTVASIQQQLPQIGAHNFRLTKSHAWAESLPPGIQYGSPSWSERAAQINVNGTYYTHKNRPPQKVRLSGTADLAATGILTGVATSFLTELRVGDRICVDDGHEETITEVTSDTVAKVFSDTPAVVAVDEIYKLTPNVQEEKTQQSNLTETVFQPPLSLFSQDVALAGNWELILGPKSSSQFRTSAMQNDPMAELGNAAFPAAGLTMATSVQAQGAAFVPPTADASFDVDDIWFMVAIVESSSPNASEEQVVLSLEDVACQPRRISGGQVVESYQVPRSTFATAFALQDENASTSTLYPPTLFKAGDATTVPDGNSGFNVEQNGLSTWSATYASQLRNNPNNTPTKTPGTQYIGVDPFGGSGVDYTAWNYLETQIANGGAYDNGGPLSAEFNRNCGQLISMAWRKPAGSLATDFQLNATYGTFANAARHNLLLFTSSRSVVEYQLRNNQVVGFSSQSA